MTKKQGEVTGKVVYSAGDGPEMKIPEGPIEVELSSLDATLNWNEEDVVGLTAMPIEQFNLHVKNGTIRLEP